MKRYVVLNEAGHFLSGTRCWSSEYPEARLFSTIYGAGLAASDAGGGSVLEDYGLGSERVCLVADSDGNILPVDRKPARGAHE